ncbi:MAG: hypothetical protein RJQ08_10940 [Salinisphaeraceae bacterium]
MFDRFRRRIRRDGKPEVALEHGLARLRRSDIEASGLALLSDYFNDAFEIGVYHRELPAPDRGQNLAQIRAYLTTARARQDPESHLAALRAYTIAGTSDDTTFGMLFDQAERTVPTLADALGSLKAWEPDFELSAGRRPIMLLHSLRMAHGGGMAAAVAVIEAFGDTLADVQGILRPLRVIATRDPDDPICQPQAQDAVQRVLDALSTDRNNVLPWMPTTPSNAAGRR